MADEYVGSKLRITTEEGTYEGTVHRIDPVKRRLTLSKVISCAKGKPPKSLHGFHNFFGHELNNLEILGKDESNQNERKDDVESYSLPDSRNNRINTSHPQVPSTSLPTSTLPGTNLPGTNLSPYPGTSNIPNTTRDQNRPYLPPPSKPHQNQSPGQVGVFRNALHGAGLQFKKPSQEPGVVTKDASDEGNVLLKRPPLAAEQYLQNDFYLDDGEELSPQSPPKAIILDENNDRFHNAIKNINSQRVVGLSCEGVNLGRNGKVCWLIIGCRHFTYLFDIISLGDSSFDHGLAEILENGNILKVTHDCRQMSDALFHQYSIKLINVFDTQVADIIIYKQEKGGNLPRTVNGLVACLYEYLNLSPEQCHFQKVRINNMQKDEAIWSRRPLSQQVTDAAAKRVMYLRELRLAQMERMMAEFIYGVNIYISTVRDGKDYRVNDKKYISKSRQLPQQFQELYQFQNRVRARKYDDEFGDETRDEHQPIKKNDWQDGEQFSDTYRNVHGHIKEQSAQPLPAWDVPWGLEGRGRGTGTEVDTNTQMHNSGYSLNQMDNDNNAFGFKFNSFGENISNDFREMNISDNSPQSGQPQGLNGSSATNVSTNFGPARDQGTHDQRVHDQGIHDQRVRDQGPRDQGIHDQRVHDQGPRDQRPLDQGPRDQGIHNQRVRDQGPRDQRPLYQGPRDQGIHNQRVREQGPRDQGFSRSTDVSPKSSTNVSRNFAKNTSTSAIFKEEDFPPLSDSSDSSTSNFSTSPKPKLHARNPRDDNRRLPAMNYNSQPPYGIDSRGIVSHSSSRGYTHNARQDNFTHNAPQETFTHNTPQETTSHNARQDTHAMQFQSQSPVPTEPFVGRGRASLFQHMSNIPHARLPRSDDEPPWRSNQPTVGGLANRHTFPSDNELLATPQVTHVAESTDFIRGGTRVRVRQT